MIFRSGVFSRKAGLTPSEFTAHWTRIHGELASKLPGLHRYVQNHIDERLYERAPFPAHAIDGISQLWFDDIAAMERAEDSPEYAACKLDIPRFQGEITILVLQDVRVVDGPDADIDLARPAPGHAAPVKLFWFATLTSGTAPDADALRERWQQQAQALKNGPPVPGLLRYVQNVVVDRAHPVAAGVPQGQLPADVMGELWFADRASLDAWLATAVGRAAIFDNPLLAPLGVYVGHEVPIV